LEIATDPYLRSLQQNYYYPLSEDVMVPVPDQSLHHDSMIVDGESAAPQGSQASSSSKQASSTEKRRVTIEDSMDVISELISEIQSSDTQPPPHPINPQDHPKPPIKQKGKLCLSLARRSKSGNSSLAFLPLLKKFFHTLLSTGTITILPIRNDSRAQPLQLSSQINELTVIGSKTFIKPSKPNGGSIARDLHVSTSLSFQEICDHPKIINWMTLNGYFLVLSNCQTSDMVKIGFLSRV
jgi:hypothetical protein